MDADSQSASETPTTSPCASPSLVCDNMAFHGAFTPVLAKHTKHLSLVDILSVGVDRMQRNFEPIQNSSSERPFLPLMAR